MNIRQYLQLQRVMPVIVIDELEVAVPLARALVAGGVRVLEVTLRTPPALDAVRAIVAEVPEAVVGVGTLLSPKDIEAAREAGAVFGVSPGATPALLRAAREIDWPMLPGVMTPSDVIAALAEGYDTLKLFPTMQAGGVSMLKALQGPFPGVRFCPTGGIDASSAPEFLALANVVCVGGSWLAPAAAVRARDWASITQAAHQSGLLHG